MRLKDVRSHVLYSQANNLEARPGDNMPVTPAFCEAEAREVGSPGLLSKLLRSCLKFKRARDRVQCKSSGFSPRKKKHFGFKSRFIFPTCNFYRNVFSLKYNFCSDVSSTHPITVYQNFPTISKVKVKHNYASEIYDFTCRNLICKNQDIIFRNSQHVLSCQFQNSLQEPPVSPLGLSAAPSPAAEWCVL